MTSSPPPSSVMAAFDLPAMPPSFEDFQFSLNLPENITPMDFNLVSSPGFGSLFGMSSMGQSGPFTPSALLASSHSTPKGGYGPGGDSYDDTIMTMTSPTTARPPISALGLGADGHMTSMPGPSTSTPREQSSERMMSFDEYMARNAMSSTPQLQNHQPGSAGSNGNAPQSLFDAKETNFLTNFLQGFEGWDFNPNLPLDLPSFTEAERGAYAFGKQYQPPPPPSLQSLPSGSDYRRHSRKSTTGSKGKSSPSAGFSLSQSSPSSGRMETSAGAAFGRPLVDWNEEEEGQVRDERGRRKSSNQIQGEAAMGKKIKTEHGSYSQSQRAAAESQAAAAAAAAAAASKKDLLSDHEKRQNHILSEQRRRNHIREAFKELVDLLEAGREFGARGLGLSSGAGTGIEDEGLDDRSDYESTLEDEESTAAAKRKKAKAKRRAAVEAVLNSGGRMSNGSAATRGRGKGRGRGGSAGGGAGSKSAVLFQAVDLLRWLSGRNEVIERQVQELEDAAPVLSTA